MKLLKLGLLAFVLVPALLAQMPEEISNMLGEKPKGENQAGKRDCDEAKKNEEKAAAENMNDPIAGVTATGKAMCSPLENIAWQPSDETSLPQKAKGKNIPTDKDFLAGAKGWWSGTSDAEYVKVLSAGVTDSEWNTLTMSDTPGVASGRAIRGYHVIKAKLAGKKEACFIVPMSKKQENLNFPNALLKPKWGNTIYYANTPAHGQKISCKAAK
jgi:hypothetical protein